MTKPTNNQNPRSALRDALAADVWAMSDDAVRQEADASGVSLESAAAAVSAVRQKAIARVRKTQSGTIVPLDGKRARAIFERLASRRALPHNLQMVADTGAPTEAEALDAIQRLDAEGLLPEGDLD